MIIQIALLILGAYVIGATPFGFLMGKFKGLDIRDHGSGNIGATNVFRIVGKKEGVFVFLLDVIKGLVPVLISRQLVPEFEGFDEMESRLVTESGELGTFVGLHLFQWVPIIYVLIALATIIGHNHTFWLGFKGGKGVATSGGALIALMPWAVLAAAVVWGLVFFTSRYVSVASICAALTVPVAVLVQGFVHGSHEASLLVLGVVVAILGVWRHRVNIARLRDGTEARMSKKS